MIVWKLCFNLQPQDQSQWDELAECVLGPGVHAGRKLGFQLSREALRTCLSEIGVQREIPNLLLEGFDRLKEENNLTLSLSHSSSTGAAAVAHRRDYRALGIDIELDQRPVKSDIIRRISHPEDLLQEDIVRWTLKEAIFKACMNTHNFNTPFEFSSIQILDHRWQQSSGLSGEWQVQKIEGHIVALAWIKI